MESKQEPTSKPCEEGEKKEKKFDVEQMEQLKPELIMAVERLDSKMIKKFLYNGWDVNFPLTSVGIAFLSLVMGIAPEIVD